MKKAIGVLILALVFGGLFAAQAFSQGIVVALITWGIAIAVTALVIFAAYLLS